MGGFLVNVGDLMGAKRATPPSPPAFSPSDIPNLALWLDAADPDYIAQVGGAVNRWLDKSGKGNDAVQESGAWQPATGARTINGKNALNFQEKFLAIENANINIFSSNFTTIAVLARDFTDADYRVFSSYTPISGVHQLSTSSGSLVSGRNTSSWGTATGPAGTPNTSPYAIGMRKNGSDVRVFAGGNNLGSAHTDASAHEASFTGLRIGLENTGYARFKGAIAEILFYSRNLTADEMNALGDYLNQKWGITWTAF